MKVTLESTDRIVEINGLPGRVWEGISEKGVRCHAVITRIAVHQDADCSEFEKELREQHAPASADAIEAIPLRMIL